MKTLHTIYTSFAKRLAIILTLLLTLGVTSAWGETYEYDFSQTTVWYTTSSKTTNVSNAEDLSKFYDKNGVEWQVSSNPDRARFNSGYFILGKSGAYITLPTFSGEKITSVVITASGGHSTSVSVNIMTNSGTAASTNQTWSTTGKTHTYEISSSYQSSSLRIQVTNAYRTQFTKVTINTESVATAYNVTWNNDGHGTIPSTSPTSASSVTLPSLTATGYAHSGWKANVDVKNTSTGATISANTLISNGTTVTLTQATTFTAQWKINSYTVTWKPNGGNWSGNASDKVEDYNYGATITTPSNPTRYGYNFTGWTPTPATTMPASDQTYIAQWKEKDLTNYRTSCTTETIVTLDPNGGTISNTDGWTENGNGTYSKTHEGTEIALPTATKTNYIFGGWYNGETKYESIPSDLDESITLTAKWLEKQDAGIYWDPESVTVTIDADGNILPEFNNPNEIDGIEFSSSNPSVVAVDANGVITLGSTGTTAMVTITATFDGNETYAAKTVTCSITVHPSNCKWVETNIIEHGDEVVITMTGTNGITYTLSNTSNTENAPSVVEVNNISGTYITSVVDGVKWGVNKDGDNLTFKSYLSDNYLYCTNNNNGVRVGNTGSSKIFTIDNESGYLKHTVTNRYLGVYNNQDWRCYTDKDKFAGQTLKFYKKECLDSETFWVDYNLANTTCTTAPPHSQIAKSETLTLNFASADGYALPDNVTVTNASKTWDKSTGTLTISNPTANVTITIEALKLHTVTWMVGSSSVLTEEVANGTGVTQTPTKNPEDGAIGSCANKFMGWSETSLGSAEGQSAPSDLCTAAQMKSKHTNVTGDKTFYAVFATAKTDEGEDDVTTTFDFTSGYENGTAIGTKTQDGVTITFGKGDNNSSKPTYYDSGNAVRVYAKNTITVACTGLTKITFTFGSDDGSNTITANTASFSTPTWTGSANSVKFTIGGSSGNRRIQKVAVTYTATTSITTYSNYVTNCCNTPAPTNGAYTSVSGTEIKLTWEDAANTNRYHITGGNLSVEGVYEKTNKYYNIIGLTECEEYTFYVSAYPEDGCESEAIAITAQPFSGAKTVTFNYNGNGQANTTSSTSCGNTSITLPTPTWVGYRFMGWYTAVNGGEKVNDNPYTPTSDITLYAQWEKEYNVTYNANGGSTTCAGGAYIAGETVTVCTTNPNNTGHTFTGWTYSPSVTITDGKFVMPASDVTITAQWQVNSYTVTWKPNGGNWGGSTENVVETYEYGATIVQPAAPQRDGYRFTGWSPAVSSTMPAGDKTYTAQWKQNYTITFYDGADVTPWTQTKDAESINLTEYVGTLACDDYQFAGWSTDATKYDDEPANITTWVTGTYTPTANIHLYAVYVKGDLATDFTLNCDGGVYEIWEKGHNQHMAGRQNGGGDKFYTTEYWDANNSESNGAPFTITKVADQTYTLQNADGQYITRDSYYEDELEIEETWENADRYKWTISNGTNGTWRFTNKAATSYALVYYDNRYFELRSASSVTAGNTTTYDLELTPAASNVYQSNPNCGPYYIIFNTHGGEFIQGEEYPYGEEQTGLTETTYAKFPAAELEGYTFAGWKDGSPIDGEITSDNTSDAPYLKQAGEDLVVSSNKTYHAVYYYYDEEEDIDFSKEFTTSIYAEVNGMKYFLAGTPSSGTMSSTTDCGYVSEVTITPGTGTNAGKYKITVNGVAMAPKANETDLLNGTYWWTITERSVGSGEYKISGQDKKNIVLRNSSWGHYTYNQGSEYGNNYYYPRFGKCLQHHWTSNPTLKPSLNLSGEVYVTATNARGIMATSTLKVSAQQLNANEKVNITSNSNDVYFSADCTVNFVKANKPTNTLTITASPSGVIEQDIYVHYKPSTEGNGTPASVVVSANLATPNPSVTDDQTIYVRNLPAKFVIATKVGATWYALPADMSSATNPLGVVIEVDETTMTTIAPNTTTYTLWPVKTTATEYDRYTNVTGAAYGDRVRFAAVNNNKGLWANNSKTDLTINNDMVIDQASDGQTGSDLANNSYYEWKVTTTVVDGHWQYTLQTDQTQNQNYLRYWVGATGAPKWGTYAAGNNQLYFLPVTETKPFDYKVVEWYPTKMLIQTDATIANPTAKIGDAPINNVTCTNKGDKLYEIAGLPLESNPTKVLTIKFSDGGNNYTNATAIPVIISQSATTVSSAPFTTLTKDVYNYADLVVRDGATLTIDGETHAENTFFNVTIYPTSKISVPSDEKLTVHSLTFFGGIDEIYNGSTYDLYKYGVPELSLKGTLKKSISTIDYLMRVDSKQMYSLTVPYDVQLADIKYWDGTNIVLGDELWVSAYDGASRAQNQGNGKNWIYEADFNPATLKAGVGYTISAEMQAGVGNEYSILRMPMMSNVANDATEGEKKVSVTAHGIDANITDNHKGWNLVGNPYMTSISGGEADSKLVLGYLQETGTGPWKWVEKVYRYVTIPSDDGTYYRQQNFTTAELPPFKNFFVQIGTTGDLQFDLGTRQSMPARSTQAVIEKEVEFEILMSNDARQDNTGLLISEEYSPAYEINADLEKMTGSMSVYTIFGGYKLAYNALSPINASEWIPMGYIAPAAGEYTFRLDDVEKIVEQVEHVYVIDYDANNIVDLMTDEYKFTTDKEQNDNRFAINVVLIQDKDNTTTGLDIINGNNTAPIKFIYHDKIYIKSGEVIYDGTGKQVTNINK